VKTGGFHLWKNVRRTFSTASEQAVDKQPVLSMPAGDSPLRIADAFIHVEPAAR